MWSDLELTRDAEANTVSYLFCHRYIYCFMYNVRTLTFVTEIVRRLGSGSYGQ
jgi:hypothetical protein